MRSYPAAHEDAPVLGVFISASVLGGAFGGIISKQGIRYAELAKPWFAPPEWAFAPLWLATFVALAIVGWRVWRSCGPFRELLLAIWGVQLVLNWLWPPIFLLFGPSELALMTVLVSGLGLLCLIPAMWQDDLSKKLLLPCFGWLGVMFGLTGTIVAMN